MRRAAHRHRHLDRAEVRRAALAGREHQRERRRFFIIGSVGPGGAGGRTISFKVWVPAGPTLSRIEAVAQDYNWGWTQSWNGAPAANTWSTVTLKLPANAVSPLQRLSLKFNMSGAWVGIACVDSISWTPP